MRYFIDYLSRNVTCHDTSDMLLIAHQQFLKQIGIPR
jgi:hypothetical protein